MKKNKFEDFKAIKDFGFNPATCLGHSENGSICGAYATKSLEMPDGIPDMPFCGKHYDEAKELWDMESIMLLIEAMMFGDEDE